MKFKFVLLLFLCLFVFGHLSAQEGETLILVTHDSFNISEDVLSQFEAESDIKVEILRLGDAGQIVNQSILSKENPLGDVLFGIDNTFLSRALEADLFIPYESPALAAIPPSFIIDEAHHVTPIDYGDVCLNYDIAYFEENTLPLPESLADLTNPQYKGLLVVENPATSSPGLAFLLTTIGAFGTEGDYTYLDFWADLLANETLVVDGWETAYFAYFTAASEDGTYPLVVSYASSPPFTVDAETGVATTGSIVADGTCFRQIEFAGILKGTQKIQSAQQLIDYMLSIPFQEDVPFQMYVFPINPQAELPEDFAKFAAIPQNPAVVEPSDIELNRESWIRAWSEVFLR